jgi:Mrp family chromosome partitioning ATPase
LQINLIAKTQGECKKVASKEEIMSKLREVVDPEIGINIVDLGMVRDIVQDGGDVTVKIALTVRGCPLAATLDTDIRKIVAQLPGISSVKVEMGSMSKEELQNLAQKLQSMKKQQRSAVGTASAMSSGIDRLERKGIECILAIISGKGGVGKSFVSSIVAVELRRQGYEVGLLDADITGPSLAKIFGLSGKPLADEHGVIPKESKKGIKVISMNLLLDKPETPVIWRGPIINGVIRQLFSDVNWGDLHYLIVDLPPGTGDAPLTVFQSLPVDAAVVVSTPQDLSMLIVQKAINMARQLKVPIAGIVENMSFLDCPHCSEKIELFEDSGISEKASSLGIKFLGKLPFDPKINRLSDAGEIEEFSSVETTEFVRKLRHEVNLIRGFSASPIAWKKSLEVPVS